MSFFFLFPDTSGGGGQPGPAPEDRVDYVEVADELARLALTNPGDLQEGDIVQQLDNNTWWRLEGADPSQASSWIQHFQVSDLSAYVRYLEVADEASRLALNNPLNVKEGDVVKQIDTGQWWRLDAADPSLSTSWKQHFIVIAPDGYLIEIIPDTADGDDVLVIKITDNTAREFGVMATQLLIDQVLLPQAFQLDYENGEGWV